MPKYVPKPRKPAEASSASNSGDKIVKSLFPRKFPGVNVIQEGRNDGIRVCLIHSIYKGKPVDKLAFFKIYEMEDGFYWKPRPFKRKSGHIWKMWDVVSINRSSAPALARAILKLAGKEPEEKEEEMVQDKKTSELLELAKEIDGE